MTFEGDRIKYSSYTVNVVTEIRQFEVFSPHFLRLHESNTVQIDKRMFILFSPCCLMGTCLQLCVPGMYMYVTQVCHGPQKSQFACNFIVSHNQCKVLKINLLFKHRYVHRHPH